MRAFTFRELAPMRADAADVLRVARLEHTLRYGDTIAIYPASLSRHARVRRAHARRVHQMLRWSAQRARRHA